MPRWVLFAGAAAVLAGVLLLLLTGRAANDGVATVAGGNAPAPASALSAASPQPPTHVAGPQSPATRAVARAVPESARQTAGAAQPVSLTVTAAQTLQVGATAELVFAVGSNAGVGEIAFTLQFDGNLLQVRAATGGDWASGAGGNTRFTADISGAEDRVQVHSRAPGPALAAAGGSVAVVQFQAVAPGSTSVMVSDVMVKDTAGNAMPFLLSASTLQVTADAVPPRQALNFTP